MHNVNVYLITMNVNKKIQKYKRTKANKSQWGPRTDRKNAHARRYTFLSNFVKKILYDSQTYYHIIDIVSL